MKKNNAPRALAFFGLWLAVLLPLSAQNGGGETGPGYDYAGRAIVSILPFTGDAEAAEAFHQAVNQAVEDLQKYSPRPLSAGAVEAAGLRIPTDMPPSRELVPAARYALTGGVYPGTYQNQYYLQLWLWDMATSSMIYSDDLVYQDIEKGLVALPGLVEWLFEHIIEVPPPAEAPPEAAREEKLLNLGIISGLSQRWYTAPDETTPGAHALVYEGGLAASVRLHPRVSLRGEVLFTFDHLVFRGVTDTIPGEGYAPVLASEKYRFASLTFPFTIKARFKPGGLLVEPFAGIYAFLPLGEGVYENRPAGDRQSFSLSVIPLGYTLGFDLAIPWGDGVFFAGLRYGEDFDTLTMRDGVEYKRRMVSISAGYSLSFITIHKQGD
jgi:hypothetical protein